MGKINCVWKETAGSFEIRYRLHGDYDALSVLEKTITGVRRETVFCISSASRNYAIPADEIESLTITENGLEEQII